MDSVNPSPERTSVRPSADGAPASDASPPILAGAACESAAPDGRAPQFQQVAFEVERLLRDAGRPETWGALLKPLLAQRHGEVRAFHDAGATGRAVARAQSQLVDGIVRGLYATLGRGLRQSGNGTADGGGKQDRESRQDCALVALGGYGRGELNPASDVDLLFLRGGDADAKQQRLIDGILYPLWDLGFTVGHSARTIDETILFSRRDPTVLTALLEARLLAGSTQLFAKLRGRLRRTLAGKAGREFLRRKLAERDRRHAQFENSPTLLEPNVKESPGGLRDLHTALWATQVAFGVHQLEELEANGLCTPEELGELQAALDFFLRVRTQLHYLTGRRTDILVMEMQDALSAALGYTAQGGLHAVERFMREYYRHAVSVYLFSRTTLWRCSDRPGWARRGLRALRRRRLDANFAVDGGRIEFSNGGGVFLEQPLLALQLFLSCAQHHFTISEEVSRELRSALYSTRRAQALRSPAGNALFLRLLAAPHAAKALRMMHQLGVLAIFLPEFDELTGLIQYHLFHRYTIDDHSLRAVRYIDELPATTEPEIETLGRLAAKQANPGLVKLALLCHDLGKSCGGGHVASGTRMVRGIVQRLGLPKEEAETVIFLVQHHLLMNHTAQRRNLDDAAVVARFGQVVGSVERLEMLYLLTYADTRAVGPNVWTTWKGALLLELYEKGARYLCRELDVGDTIEQIMRQARAKVERQAGEEIEAEEIERFFELMPPRYFCTCRPEQIVRHIVARREAANTPLVMRRFPAETAGQTELLVITEGRRGVFSKIAGILAARRINILAAQVYTDLEGMAVDTLWVDSAQRQPVGDPGLWPAVEEDLRKVLAGDLDVRALIRSQDRFYSLSKRRPRLLPSSVHIDNTVADECTVLDIVAEDHVGLLYAITQTLYDQGLDIVLAKISTEGNRATDTFYVTDSQGEKLLDSGAQEALARAVREALEESFAMAPA
ncbi:MAG: [protein-PII] uridylyltransferase [Candidatus Tectomicrobia bacterium]|nr:[protein-PII] uridylyltransferase [Candidatus Tectomicrobia bacterium]